MKDALKQTPANPENDLALGHMYRLTMIIHFTLEFRCSRTKNIKNWIGFIVKCYVCISKNCGVLLKKKSLLQMICHVVHRFFTKYQLPSILHRMKIGRLKPVYYTILAIHQVIHSTIYPLICWLTINSNDS